MAISRIRGDHLATKLCIAVLAAILVPDANASPTTADAPVKVTVQVRAAGDFEIREAYVALVPEWRASGRPLVEQIVKSSLARFAVPPGNYFIIGGAVGFSVASRGPISLSGLEMDLWIELLPLELTAGTVRDDTEAPVQGARVSTWNGAVDLPLGKLSELAVRHLTRDFSTTTGADGTWALPLPDGAVPLVFEASGRAAIWKIIPAGESGVAVTLTPGAQLTVTADRDDQDVFLTLVRGENSTPTTIPADRQSRLWARPAKQKRIIWDALPPGSYAIFAQYLEPSLFMANSIEIGTIALSSGEQQHLQVALPDPTLLARISQTALFLRNISPASLGSDVQAFGRASGGGAVPLKHAVEEVMGGAVLHVSLTEEARPPFFATTEDYFISTDAPDVENKPTLDGVPIAVRHWRAEIDAHFRSLEPDLQLPSSGLARQRGCKNHEEIEVPFSVRASGFARFALAAECRYLLLELESFEPVVISKVLHRGKQSLGEIVLRAAASADVRVVRDPGGELVAGAAVEIVALGDLERASQPVVVARAMTDDAGWARFRALPPYHELRATASTEDGSRSDGFPLRLAPRESGVIDPLRLGEPSALIITVGLDKAFLARFPSARVATLFIQPVDPFRVSEKQQQNVTGGAVRFTPLAPGKWLINALVIVTPAAYAPFEIEMVELQPGEARQIDATVVPNVFEGIVTSEGKPVVAKVKLADGDRTLGFLSDASGEFRVVLERTGVYRVAVARLSAQGNDIPIGNVSFTDPSRRIEIKLPESATVVVRARVDDRPARLRTLVRLSRRDETGFVDRMTARGRETNEAGEVTFDDLAPGVWTFTAEESETGARAEKSVSIEGAETQMVDLVLTKGPAIRGTLRDLGGMSLSRARIECLFVGPSGNVDRGTAMSDAEGQFEIRLVDPAPPAANCSVITANGTVGSFRATTSARSDFTLPAATGALLVPGWGEVRNQDRHWLVSPDGRAVSLSAVAAMFGQSRASMMIPALAAGRWRVVRIESFQQWLALGSGLGASLPADAEFTLRAGATETIQLNIPAP